MEFLYYHLKYDKLVTLSPIAKIIDLETGRRIASFELRNDQGAITYSVRSMAGFIERYNLVFIGEI